MKINLQPALQILTLDRLQKTFLPQQRTRRDKVIAAVEDGTRRIDEARKAVHAAMPKFGHRQPNGNLATDPNLERAGRTVANHQIAAKVIEIRKEVDDVAVPLLKEMIAAADQAKVYAERHWDAWSVLRRSKGLGTGTANFAEAMTLRASYATILRGCDPIELNRWAQQAIDQADSILADCVARENLTRNNRSFSNQSLAERIALPDYTAAQAALNEVLRLQQEAGVAYAGFGKEIGAVAFQRIGLGLARQGDELLERGEVSTLPSSIPVLR